MSERNEFYEEQTGVFNPDFNIEKAQNSKKTTLRLVRWLFKQKWRLLLVVFSILASSLFEILSPKVLGTAINEIYNGVKNAAAHGAAFRVNYETMGSVLLTLLGLYLLQSVFSFIQQRTMTTISQRLTLSLRKEISGKLTRLPLRYFDGHQKGEILSRITNDIEKMSDTMEESLTRLISSVIGIAGALIMMVMISPVLTLISLAAIGLSMGIAFLIASKTERSFAENQEILGSLRTEKRHLRNGTEQPGFRGRQ